MRRSRYVRALKTAGGAFCTALALLAAGCVSTYPLPVQVPAAVETESVPSAGDAADDPAIWVHPSDPAQSLVVGTDKRSGLLVFDLAGTRTQYLELGNPNNVDLRSAPWGQADRTLVGASGASQTSFSFSI